MTRGAHTSGLGDQTCVSDVIEAFVHGLAVEAFDELFLLRPTCCDKVLQHRPFFLPSQDRVRSHPDAAIADHHHGEAAMFLGPVEFA